MYMVCGKIKYRKRFMCCSLSKNPSCCLMHLLEI